MYLFTRIRSYINTKIKIKQTLAFSREESVPEAQELRERWQNSGVSGAGPVEHTLVVVLPLRHTNTDISQLSHGDINK